MEHNLGKSDLNVNLFLIAGLIVGELYSNAFIFLGMEYTILQM
jgi:hypothetical protein